VFAASRVSVLIWEFRGHSTNWDVVNDDVGTGRAGTHRSIVCEPGRYTATWDGTDARVRRMANGIYFYRLDLPGFRSVKKAVLMRWGRTVDRKQDTGQGGELESAALGSLRCGQRRRRKGALKGEPRGSGQGARIGRLRGGLSRKPRGPRRSERRPRPIARLRPEARTERRVRPRPEPDSGLRPQARHGAL
jgi:hypothetical protein